VKFDRSDEGTHRDLTHHREDKAAVAATHTSEAQAAWDAIASAAPEGGSMPAPAGGEPAPPAPPPEHVRSALDILGEVMAAKAAGDQAMVDRLKAEMAQLQGDHPA
jgi:hypothetical protein